jgi:GNAT superfamily N-acetyltransferase
MELILESIMTLDMALREKLLGRSGAEIIYDGGDGPKGSAFVTIKGNSLKIGYLGVIPESRGKGIGQELLEGVEDWARKKGVDQITGKLIPTPGS